jgi:hypothetical protein
MCVNISANRTVSVLKDSSTHLATSLSIQFHPTRVLFRAKRLILWDYFIFHKIHWVCLCNNIGARIVYTRDTQLAARHLVSCGPRHILIPKNTLMHSSFEKNRPKDTAHTIQRAYCCFPEAVLIRDIASINHWNLIKIEEYYLLGYDAV